MRVSFVAGNLSDGGGVNRVISSLSAIVAEQLSWDVTIVAVGTAGAPSYRISDRVELHTACNDRPIRWRDALAQLRRDRPDVVIGPWTQSNFILILGLLFSRIRVVAVENASWDFHPRWIRALRRLIYPLAWRVVAVNSADLAHYGRFLANVVLLPNPVTPVSQQPSSKREKLVLCVGHLLPNKNFADAIKAMALSGLEQGGWRLAIIGSGPEEPALREEMRRVGLINSAIEPPSADIGEWFQRASMLLVTSKSEVFSLVLAEAMSAGVVPIAYAADGPAFILEKFPEHLVPIGDVEALADRLRALASNPAPNALRADLSKSISERFSPEAIGKQWQQMLGDAERDRSAR